MANEGKKTDPTEKFSGTGGHYEDDRPGADPDLLDDPEALMAAEDAEDEDVEDEPKDDSETLKAQIADLTDRLLRAHAEMDNQRKLAERERQDTAKYGISKFARDIVQVGDNFQRAIAAVPEDAVNNDPALKSFLDGVSMADREFHNILERHGIQRIEPIGDAFDPHFHQAMMEQDDATVPHGTILQVVQAGYVLADRVLRPAMVVVAKGGAKPGAGGGEDKAAPPTAANENTHGSNDPGNSAS